MDDVATAFAATFRDLFKYEELRNASQGEILEID